MYIFEYTKTKCLNSVQTQWWHYAGGYFAFGKIMQFLHNFPHNKILKLHLSQGILARKANFTPYTRLSLLLFHFDWKILERICFYFRKRYALWSHLKSNLRCNKYITIFIKAYQAYSQSQKDISKQIARIIRNLQAAWTSHCR